VWATLANRGPGEFVDPAVTPDRPAVLLDDDVVVRSFRMTAYRLAGATAGRPRYYPDRGEGPDGQVDHEAAERFRQAMLEDIGRA
jgi:hypothetical protein